MSASNLQKSNLGKAREAMVVSQLQPAGIISEAVLEAYRSVAREDFVPEHLRSVCYLDESLKLDSGQVMLEPLLHGLMVEELDIQRTDRALDVGDTTGYSAAILAKLAGTVVPGSEDTQGSFDVIVVNGAVAEIPEKLMTKLDIGGRLACILIPDGKGVGKVVIATKEASGAIAKQVFEDASAAYIPGYEPKDAFIF